MPQDRRLAAIMFTDIVGYTKLMGSDEEMAVDMLSRNRSIHQTCLEKYNGSLIKEIGDGILASFALASDAVRCAIDIQKECKEQSIPLKIGIHEGEMVFEGSDIIGDGVNIAARLQEASREGCILISGKVYSDIKNRSDIKARYVGSRKLKNVEETIKVYEVDYRDGEQNIHAERKPKLESPLKNFKRRQEILAVLAVIVLITVTVLIWQYGSNNQDNMTSPQSMEVEKSIAVLPFKYLSSDQGKRYLSEGVMDVITSHLAKISALQVKARTSVEKYRDNLPDVTEIGQELKVNYIVEGSFQMHDNLVRLTIQLIDARNGNHVFTEEYDRDWSDIFEVQSEVAQTIAREINAVINPEEIQRIETIPTGNLTAYDLYLQAEEEWKTYIRSEDTTHIDKALRLYQEALFIDSTFAEAYLGLAAVYMSGIPRKELYFKNMGIDSAQSLVEYALSLNPQSDEAYLALGSIHAFYLGKPEEGREYFNKVISLNPNNANGYSALANLDYMEENMPAAIRNFYKSYELDETFWKPWNLSAIGSCYLKSGFFNKAEFYSKEKLKLDNDSVEYLGNMIDIEYMRGNLSESFNLAEQLFQKDPGNIWVLKTMIEICIRNKEKSKALHYAVLADSLIIKEDLIALNYAQRIAHAYWINGMHDRARYYFDKQLNNCLESIRLQRPYALSKHTYYDLAGVYAFFGEKEKAYEALEEYNTKRSESAIIPIWMETDPLFDSIREEERFQRIYQEINAKYQREHNKLKAWMEAEGII